MHNVHCSNVNMMMNTKAQGQHDIRPPLQIQRAAKLAGQYGAAYQALTVEAATDTKLEAIPLEPTPDWLAGMEVKLDTTTGSDGATEVKLDTTTGSDGATEVKLDTTTGDDGATDVKLDATIGVGATEVKLDTTTGDDGATEVKLDITTGDDGATEDRLNERQYLG
ncbi:hypothetical protein C8Q76DRAFT_757407 [Earliella scabrosa]|nr:hypothetical protein C8Q76DRAFT_757407 [Earliella scabrosa]